MNNEFVPYEQSVELKELGFDEPCITCYDKLEMVASHGKNVFDYKNYNSSGYMVSRPTFSQAFRWFREKYLDILVKEYGLIPHFTIIQNMFLDSDKIWTYEEAELACLKKLIEIVKSK